MLFPLGRQPLPGCPKLLRGRWCGRGGRWCKVNLCIWKKSSSAPGKINENESSEFWPEMRKTTALDLDHFRVRNPHPNILIGTASDRYARWIGQIYSEG